MLRIYVYLFSNDTFILLIPNFLELIWAEYRRKYQYFFLQLFYVGTYFEPSTMAFNPVLFYSFQD